MSTPLCFRAIPMLLVVSSLIDAAYAATAPKDGAPFVGLVAPIELAAGRVAADAPPLVLTVEVGHPSLAGPASDDVFVLDPEGGIASALSIVATDANGRSLSWPFALADTPAATALQLDRRSRASFRFVEVEPLQRPAGIVSLRARLATSTGKWQGSAQSSTLKLTLELPEPPELTVLGLDEGPLVPGSPLLFEVALRAPLKGPGVVLPNDVAGFATALEIALQDSDAQNVPLETQMLALPLPVRGVLAPGGVQILRCRIPAAVTATRAPGTYRLTLRYRAPAPRAVNTNSARPWAGVTPVVECVLTFVPAEASPSAEASERRTTLLIADAIFEAEVLRASASRTDLALEQRLQFVRRMAAPLVRAETLARERLAAHPSDPVAALQLAQVLAARGDAEGANDAAQRSLSLPAVAPPTSADAASANANANEPSSLAWMQARAACAVPPLDPPQLQATLVAAVAAIARGEDPQTVAVSNTPTPSLATTTEAPRPPAEPPAIVGEVSTGDARELDERFAADTLGQWATGATASSQYSSPTYAAERATGAPDVASHGDSTNAWTPSAADRGVEWLRCTFATPVRAKELRVRQSFHPGTVSKVTLHGKGGRALVVFRGIDPNTYPAGQVGWFVVRFPPTDFDVEAVELELDTARIPGWNELDALQLVR